MTSASELLSVRNLRTWFDTERGVVKAVDGVSFDLRAGRVLAMVGESGCGKSVTGLSIMRLLPPSARIESGSSILFEGSDLAAMDASSMRAIRGREISLISQEPAACLNPVQKIGQQITEAPYVHGSVSRRERRDVATELLREVGVPAPETRVNSYPHELSGGMRQRAAIAMALACNPKLLIADEPTTALDVTTQAQVLELLQDRQKELGMSMIIVTHDIGVAAEVADDAVVMYAGRVVEFGRVEQVLESPQHPYTEGLLGAIPSLGLGQERLNAIPGTVPSALSWPAGCRFSARCEYAFDRCIEDPPIMHAGDHSASCWLHERASRMTRGE